MKEIFNRVSVREFENRDVEKEKIEKILKAAMQAPTAGNQQTWCFYVVSNKEKLLELSTSSKYASCCKNANLAIVVAYKDGGIFPDYNQIDCAICSENILLEVTSLGLGAVMLGIAPSEERMGKVERILEMPKDVHAFTIIPIGYPLKNREQSNRFDKNKITYID